jgi:hypothetical protein
LQSRTYASSTVAISWIYIRSIKPLGRTSRLSFDHNDARSRGDSEPSEPGLSAYRRVAQGVGRAQQSFRSFIRALPPAAPKEVEQKVHAANFEAFNRYRLSAFEVSSSIFAFAITSGRFEPSGSRKKVKKLPVQTDRFGRPVRQLHSNSNPAVKFLAWH